MFRNLALPGVLAVWLAGAVVCAGEDGKEAIAPVPTSRLPDFRVVFWYQGGALKAQAYDVRKGQYTKAVDDWVKRIHYDSTGYFVLPGPMATVRDVYLDREPGANEAEKLAAAIVRLRNGIDEANREALTTAAHIRSLGFVQAGAGVPVATSPRASYRYVPAPMASAPGSPGVALPYGPAPYPFPNPYPYVRPHP